MQSVRESGGYLVDLLARLVNKFQAEMTDTYASPRKQMSARFLSLSPEHGITASYIGHHRVSATAGILQRDAMRFAWPSAIQIAGSFR